MRKLVFLIVLAIHSMCLHAMSKEESISDYKKNKVRVLIIPPDMPCWKANNAMRKLALQGSFNTFIFPREEWFNIQSLKDLQTFISGTVASDYINDSYTIHWWLQQRNNVNNTSLLGPEYSDFDLTLLNKLSKLYSPDSEELSAFLKVIRDCECCDREKLILATEAAQKALLEGYFWNTFLGELPKIIRS